MKEAMKKEAIQRKKKKKSKRKKKTKSTVEQSDDEGKDGKIQPIENLDDDNYYVE